MYLVKLYLEELSKVKDKKTIERISYQLYKLVDWDNLLEEIEDMGKMYLDSAVSFMAVILEHLYKWENFECSEDVGYSWIKSINNARNELDVIFERHPSIRKKSAEELPTAWRIAVRRLVRWFKEDENHDLAKKYFGRFPHRKRFPMGMPLYL